MEIVKQIMESIHYIENHLLEDITYQDVAKHIYMSSFEYHRTFKILTGMTPNEYIRNRRLSKAGEDLSLSLLSVTDVAFKYQYDSLEGFSKAFSRFHEVSPLKVKQGDVSLKTFHPLKLSISFQGGESMNYKIVTLDPFYLLGKKRTFEIESEVNLIPSFWDEQCQNGLFEKLSKQGTTPGMFYGACMQVDPASNSFEYVISMKVEKPQQAEDLDLVKVDHPLWVVFECLSAEHIGEVWKSIIEEFFVHSEYQREETLDFELYHENRKDIFCELYIPIKKSN